MEESVIYLAQQLGLPGLVMLAAALAFGAAWAARSWIEDRTDQKTAEAVSNAFQSDDFRDRVTDVVTKAFAGAVEPLTAQLRDVSRRIDGLDTAIRDLSRDYRELAEKVDELDNRLDSLERAQRGERRVAGG